MGAPELNNSSVALKTQGTNCCLPDRKKQQCGQTEEMHSRTREINAGHISAGCGCLCHPQECTVL